MGRPAPHYDVGMAAEALLAAGGVLTEACKALDCTRGSLRAFLVTHPDLEKGRLHAREETLDLAETKLIEKIKGGNLTAIIFLLKTQGKSRGYVERDDAIGKRMSAPSVKVYLPAVDPRDGVTVIEVIDRTPDVPQLEGANGAS